MKATSQLNETAIKSIKWTGKDKTYGDGQGLYLLVRPSSKTWIVRKRENGKNRITTLGKWPTLKLKEARLRAAQLAVNAQPGQMTVEALAEKYFNEVIEATHKRPELTRGYLDRAIIPKMGRRKASEVTRAECVRVIQNYAREQGRNGQPAARSADQLRSSMKKLFSYAVELGECELNPLAEVSRTISGYQPTARNRTLLDDEVRLLWAENHHNARLLRFLLLTGLRISEAQKGRQAGEKWIVPSSLSKNKKPHWVHLTESAKAQLPLPSSTPTNIQAWLRRWCDRHHDKISKWIEAEEKRLEALGEDRTITPRFTPHDLRRSAATRMAGAGVEPFIVERVLNHTLEGVMAVYNREPYENQRIEAAKKLEAHILNLIEGA